MSLRRKLHALRSGPYVAIPKIAFDAALWIAVACAADANGSVVARVAAALFIGAFPLHDLLLQGHEGNHRMISRVPLVNEFFTWLTHALIGLSHTAHRAFHLEHHRRAHTLEDPEVEFLDSLIPGIPGWAYLFIPTKVHWAVNTWPLTHRTSHAMSRTVARDLLAALAFHAALALTLGLRAYEWYVLLPICTSFPLAFMIRSICEHHDTIPGSRWTSARHLRTHPVMAFLWSNVNYHLEHHIVSSVPFHRLPELRRVLAETYHGATIEDEGYLATGWKLLRDPVHFRGT